MLGLTVCEIRGGAVERQYLAVAQRFDDGKCNQSKNLAWPLHPPEGDGLEHDSPHR
jgi:hypothetical protein